jgi:hypothetical protein
LAIPAPDSTTVHQIELSIYNFWNWCPANFQGDCDTLSRAPYFCDKTQQSPESRGWGTFDFNTVLFNVNKSQAVGCGLHTSAELAPPEEEAYRSGFAHELQHLAGGGTLEFAATSGEYLAGARWENSQGMSLVNQGMRELNAGSESPYNIYRLFHAYVFGHFAGSPATPTDDLYYKSTRYVAPGDTASHGLTYLGIAQTLASDFAGSVPGADGHEMLGNLYHRFALARFADDSTGYAGGIYGFGDSGVSPRHFGWFEFFDYCNANKRVDWIPPDLTVHPGAVGTISVWTDPDSTLESRQLQLESFGSEYLIFRADSSYFATQPARTLNLSVTSVPLPINHAVKIGYLEYGPRRGTCSATRSGAYPRAVPSTVSATCSSSPGEP